MLDFFHRSSWFCLLKSILGKCLMSVLQLPNFFPFKINLRHFPMIIGHLFVIIIISRLLILFQLVDRLFFFGLGIIFSLGGNVLVFFSLDNGLSLCLNNLSWVLRLDQGVFWWSGILLVVSDLGNVLDLLLWEVELLKLLNQVCVKFLRWFRGDLCSNYRLSLILNVFQVALK